MYVCVCLSGATPLPEDQTVIRTVVDTDGRTGTTKAANLCPYAIEDGQLSLRCMDSERRYTALHTDNSECLNQAVYIWIAGHDSFSSPTEFEEIRPKLNYLKYTTAV